MKMSVVLKRLHALFAVRNTELCWWKTVFILSDSCWLSLSVDLFIALM